jgi:hypothetical protein
VETLPRQEYACSSSAGDTQKKELSYLMLVCSFILASVIMAEQSAGFRNRTLASLRTVDLAPFVKGL